MRTLAHVIDFLFSVSNQHTFGIILTKSLITNGFLLITFLTFKADFAHAARLICVRIDLTIAIFAFYIIARIFLDCTKFAFVLRFAYTFRLGLIAKQRAVLVALCARAQQLTIFALVLLIANALDLIFYFDTCSIILTRIHRIRWTFFLGVARSAHIARRAFAYVIVVVQIDARGARIVQRTRAIHATVSHALLAFLAYEEWIARAFVFVRLVLGR